MKLRDEFLSRYTKEYDFYYEAAKICAAQVETMLEANGIRAIVTFRAKRPDRLTDKIDKKLKEKQYKKIDDFYKNIVDLAGVRIALYFPGDRADLENLIENQFKVEKIVHFPQKTKNKGTKIFDGYKATHYRVFLYQNNLESSKSRFVNARIEIQVASVLMHAWAEVEHDLVYKPLSGNLSEDELRILDELNGIVLAGELSLEGLQRAYKQRIEADNKPFTSSFELSAFIYDVLKIDYPSLKTEPSMGRADLLLNLLRQTKLDTPDKVKNHIGKVALGDEHNPIAEQLIDIVLAEKPHFYKTFEKIKTKDDLRLGSSLMGKEKPNAIIKQLIGKFLTEWIEVEHLSKVIIHKRFKESQKQLPLLPFRDFERLRFLTGNDLMEYRYLKRFRNNLVHGIEIPSESLFTDAIARVRKILKKLGQKT